MLSLIYRPGDPTLAVTDELLMRHIAAGSRVIDLGCGDGRLLAGLAQRHRCRVLGVERDEAAVLGSIARGVSVLKLDLDADLRELPTDAFDFAVLSQTLQQVRRPKEVLEEMRRIAPRSLVIVPNFGHWRVRLQIAISGRAPVTHALPYEWYETPNLHFLTMRDFRELVWRLNFRVVKELPILSGVAVDRAWAANLRADSALFLLERAD